MKAFRLVGINRFAAKLLNTGSCVSDRLRGAAYYYLVIVLVYAVSGAVVAGGLAIGERTMRQAGGRGHMSGHSREVYANWDGQWYLEIAEEGYSFDPNLQSSVAFFPAYPMTARLLAAVTGLPSHLSLVVLSNVCCMFSMFVIWIYSVEAVGDRARRAAEYSILAVALVPTTFFFRVAYSESSFLLVEALFLYGMRRGWSAAGLAGIVGLATATRPVGVGLILPLLVYAWHGSPTLWRFLLRAGYLCPLGCWGVGAYIAYQWLAFGEPLAFAQTQTHWRIHPPGSDWARLADLLTAEPIRQVYDPGSPGYWCGRDGHREPLLSLRAANPAFFLATAGLVAFGAAARWLDLREFASSSVLLIIPYCTSGYFTYMDSMGRYSAVVVPAYVVLGRLLDGMPGLLVGALAGLCGALTGLYAALFASHYIII